MANDYKVTGQRLDTDIHPEGTGFQRVWQTHYEITAGPAKGTRGFVRMPTDEHSPEAVKAAIDHAVRQLQGVADI